MAVFTGGGNLIRFHTLRQSYLPFELVVEGLAILRSLLLPFSFSSDG
jgi:hypothetical protein